MKKLTKRQQRVLRMAVRYDEDHGCGYWPKWASIELRICEKLAKRGYLVQRLFWHFTPTKKAYVALGESPL